METGTVRHGSDFVTMVRAYLIKEVQDCEFQLAHKMLSISCQSSEHSLVTVVLNHLLDGGRISPNICLSLSDLLYTACTFNNQPHNGTAIQRQCELLNGVHILLNSVKDCEKIQADSIHVLTALVWSSACSIWNNASNPNIISLCSTTGSLIIPELAKIVLNLEDTVLHQASCWLLCSLIRVSPSLLNQVFDCLELIGVEADEYSWSMICCLGKICQSSSAAKQLIERRLISKWEVVALEIAREEQHALIGTLISIIECFKDLSVIETIASHFDNPKSDRLFRSLLVFVARNCSKSTQDAELTSSEQSRLPEAVIGFIQRCISFGGAHRERIAKIVCDLLKTRFVGDQKGVSLSKAVEKIVSHLIVADGTVGVQLTGVLSNQFESKGKFEDRLAFHPLFGCNREDQVLEVPLNATVSKLLPHTKKVQENENDELSNAESMTRFEFNQAVVQLRCDSISTDSALNNNWTLQKIVHRLQNSNLNDGYFALNLRIIASSSLSALSIVQDNHASIILNELSTFEYFAKCDGLRYLSCCVDLLSRVDDKLEMLTKLMASLSEVHYPQVNDEFKLARTCIETSPLKTLYAKGRDNSIRPTNYSYDVLYATMEKPILNIYNASSMLSVRGIIFEDLIKENVQARPKKSFGSLKGLQTTESQSSLINIPTVQCFEHLMIVFSLFLEIDTYGQTLVEHDISTARRLVQKFLGIKDPSLSNFAEGLLPNVYRSQEQQSSEIELPQMDMPETSTSNSFLNISALSSWKTLDQITVDLKSQEKKAKLMEDQAGKPVPPKPKKDENDDLTLTMLHVLSKCFENSKDGVAAERMRIKALNIGVLDVLLTLLSHYSKHKSVKLPIRSSGDFVVTQLIHRILLFSNDVQGIVTMFKQAKQRSTNTTAQKQYLQQTASTSSGGWAKGTGYGSGNRNRNLSQETSTACMFKKEQNETAIVYLLNSIANFINPQAIHRLNDIRTPLSTIPMSFVDTIKRSCLNTVINSYVMNDSVLDISIWTVPHKAVFGCLLAILSSNAVVEGASNQQTHWSNLVLNAGGVSIYDLIKQSCTCIDTYISKLYSEPSTSGKNMENQEDELAELLKIGKCVIALMDKRRGESMEVQAEDTSMKEQSQVDIVTDSNGYITGRPLAVAYCDTMRSLQFQSVNFFKPDGKTNLFSYYFTKDAAETAKVEDGKRVRRLAKETSSLSTSLPLSLSSSIFVLCSIERLDVMKALLTGPAETPYSNGIFEFDVHFPKSYPNVPMSVNLVTTGNGSVRFNPNLYNCGKVCLSILNTWAGRPEESWNVNSSVLQVLVSIQSLIMVPDPYFNEPGYERSRGQAISEKPSREYTANIRHQCIRWAMVEQLRNPAQPFAEVVYKHFWLKRDEICLQIEEWIRETRELIAKNLTDQQLPRHLISMEANFELLLIEFKKMTCPDGLEYCKSKFVENYQLKARPPTNDPSNSESIPPNDSPTTSAPWNIFSWF